jgi:hypothetical protein
MLLPGYGPNSAGPVDSAGGLPSATWTSRGQRALLPLLLLLAFRPRRAEGWQIERGSIESVAGGESRAPDHDSA